MKIAFVGGFAFKPKGTIQGRAYPLAVELVSAGHEVTIFLTPYDNLADSGREWVREGVRIHNLKTGATPLSYPRLLTSLLRAVASYAPDVIHIFKPKGFAGAAGTHFQLRQTAPVVLDCDDWEGWGGFNEITSYPWLLKEYIDRQERWMMRSIGAVTVASRALYTRVCEVRGRTSGVFYVPNCGASREDLRAQDSARKSSPAQIRRDFGLPDKLLIFYNGHFEPGDDIMLFCRTATPVAQRNRAAIVFVGDGPDLPKVRKFFDQHPGVPVFMIPRLPYDQFVRLIWASDVTAFPYPDNPIHRSKCSLRIIDYMAMGKPVITSAVGQNSEYIVNGESGILVSPEDEKSFADALEVLLRNPELRERLGRNAELRIREKFRWDGEALQQCTAAYEQVLKREVAFAS